MQNLLKLILSHQEAQAGIGCYSAIPLSLSYFSFCGRQHLAHVCTKGHSNERASLLIFILRSQLLTVTDPFLNAKYIFYTYKRITADRKFCVSFVTFSQYTRFRLYRGFLVSNRSTKYIYS
jgi:hypothetical protein